MYALLGQQKVYGGNKKNMENKDIRLEAKGAGVPFWKIADYLKVSEPTFTRLMRRELPAEKKAEIRAIIKELREVK